ncbi:GNAT family N-acetyltransferase [Candidatus Woesearchaeota archaeon]|nr:GNAT family N-acetyltransferase [Candidatus Woesearchaeota archaeon]
MICIREPKTKEEFNSYYKLRWELLRKPWNQPRGSEIDDDLEDKSFHIAAFDKNKIIGVGRLHKNNEEEGQIRLLAVNEDYRKKGVGREIMNKLHQKAKELKLKRIILNARKNSIGFYKKLGYKIIGKAQTIFRKIE